MMVAWMKEEDVKEWKLFYNDVNELVKAAKQSHIANAAKPAESNPQS